VFALEERNLSIAWAKLFLTLMRPGVQEISPAVVVLNTSNDVLSEIPDIREALDGALSLKGLSCDTVANTIFPISLRKPGMGADDLYRRFFAIERRVRGCHKGNRYGTYFERMVDYGNRGEPGSGLNQLQYLVGTFRSGNHRRSALQVAVFDPLEDDTNQRQRGFPCLHHVALSFAGRQLSLTAFFATQYAFERAYGNWMGLWRLGHFLAGEMGLEFVQLTSVANIALLGNVRKSDLRTLEQRARDAVENQAGFETAVGSA